MKICLVLTPLCLLASSLTVVSAPGAAPGSFDGTRDYLVGADSLQAVVVDVNHDGIPDIVKPGLLSLNQNSSSITVLCQAAP